MKFYVASSWRNDLQPSIVDDLRAQGHEVYDFRHPPGGDHLGFSWSDVDPDWTSWTPEQYVAALGHPIAMAGFASDFAAMQWADAGVLILKAGRSAHLEAGWMLGQGQARLDPARPGRVRPRRRSSRHRADVPDGDRNLHDGRRAPPGHLAVRRWPSGHRRPPAMSNPHDPDPLTLDYLAPAIVADMKLVHDERDERIASAWWVAGREDQLRATKPRRLNRLGLVAIVAAAAALLIAGVAIGRASAAPRSGQTTERVDLSALSSAAQIGAPQAVAETAGRHGSTSRPVASRPLGGAPSLAELGTAIEAGTLAFADPGLGDRYLAIPSGPGHSVRICAGSGTVSARCLDRTSTDAGPALFEQRAGRIADVSFVDFAWLCGCDPRAVGLIHGSIEWLDGPTLTAPPTDVGP